MTANTGLEGVVACSSAISSIIDGVLTYRGINIDELAERATFEEVVFLLWNGRLPKRDELETLKRELVENGSIPDEIVTLLKRLPLRTTHPMATLRTAVSALAAFDPEAEDNSEEANRRKALRLVAKVGTLVAAISRLREGKEPLMPQPGLSYAENFLYMLKGEKPEPVAAEAFDKALILHADHELNASTFAARVTVATLADMYAGVTAAIATLKGPLHGGANERVMAMLEEIGDLDRVEAYLDEKLAKKEKIMGFGHRVYKNGDPRAKHLQKMAEKLSALTGNERYYQMSVKLERLMLAKKGLKPNVDFYSATVYHSLGIPRDLFTPIFAVSRMSGWTAHILEQYANNRLIRPRAEYVGPQNVRYVPIDQR
ncbi:citrate synthase [Calditerricola satsumensis]|uniref:Citrate synthase n=1 Tax=Calditerricola satsumensis TaxID=373054 RepID=A0A8J3BAG6_9BACI|nr:citrate synthase [Calditerricola satsumensis]GGJ93036.1 citrate synthase 2 [Calditerricola satsumensis]